MEIKNRLLAFEKYVLSFRKNDWELCDYPITISKQEHNPEIEDSRLQQFKYWATIVNWHLSGHGNTENEAFESLRNVFGTTKNEKKKKGELLPRPGTHVPIQFSSQEMVNKYPELADDFIHRVLEMDWAWISDESSLWDFHGDESNDFYIAKIKEVYDVDVSDIQSAKLSEILERISENNRTKNLS